ncbi:MAG: alpha/beta hydrolase [Pseudomonadota bacterium]
MTQPPAKPAPPAFREINFRVRDGLKLYGRHYPARSDMSVGRPVLCLPGLTRNSRDFEAVAEYLSQTAIPRRDVYTIDFRGRGLSDWDPNWKNYTVPLEAMDVIDFATLNQLHDAAIIGTSRGGLVAMIIAAMQPSMIGCTILNDIGPVLEPDGLLRIASYVGKTPIPGSWSEATASVKQGNKRQFPNATDEDWAAIAKQLFNEKNGRPSQGYDPKIGNAFSVLDGPMPAIWPQFDALSKRPVMVIRGEETDLLSEQTVETMCRRHPRCESYTVPGEGHAPLLRDQPTLQRIAAFLQATDSAKHSAVDMVA